LAERIDEVKEERKEKGKHNGIDQFVTPRNPSAAS
jgi:hypothetical protein